MAKAPKTVNGNIEDNNKRLDDAARAGWLYYVAGKRQDEIAEIMGVSRQSAQRLVSLAMSSGIIKVRVDHSIARCQELAEQLRSRFNLEYIEIVPDDPTSNSTTLGVSNAAAEELENWLKREEPQIIAIGTGQTLKATIDLLPKMDCPQHKIISLAGNLMPDGAATFYSVIFAAADKVKALSYPMVLPVIASSIEERDTLHAQSTIQSTLRLAQQANIAFVGIGDLDAEAPIYRDGFVSHDDLKILQKAGGVGEICGWVFNADGQILDGLTNDLVASGPLPSPNSCLIIALAKGKKKLPGLAAAIKGKLVNGLITDETMALALLKRR